MRKTVTNTILTMLATLAAVCSLAFGFGARTAMAVDTYAPTVITSGVTYDATTGVLTAPISSNGAVDAGYTHVYAQYSSQQISEVHLAAVLDSYAYLGQVDTDDFKVAMTLTDEARATAQTVQIKIYMTKEQLAAPEDIATHADKLVVTVDGSDTLEYTIPATGEGDTTTGDSTADTGVAVLPYALVAALLVAAAIALLATRRSDRRSR